jgi:UDP-N-acetylmuramate dehydrogenase
MRWPLDCVRPHEPLADHTSFRIGGPAEWFAEPSTLEELRDVLRAASRLGLPVSVVAGGTNTLAPDRGLRGVVVRLGSRFRTVRLLSPGDSPGERGCSTGGPQSPRWRSQRGAAPGEGEASSALVACGASLTTQRLVALAMRHGWGELSALAGLPGRVGGAVVMNAQGIGRFVQEVGVMSFDGEVQRVGRERLRFAYRHTTLEPGIIVEVVLEFPTVPPLDAAEGIRQALAYRNRTQDVRLPSAGCAFKNPPGLGAGRLIDEAGLKGVRIGDAQVSVRHANFIVNLGQATCDDVLGLMEHIQRRVHRLFRITLEPEVRLIGERLG